MTNKEWLSTLSAEELWKVLDWLMHDYGMQYTNTPIAVIEWLNKEHYENDSQKK